MVFLCSAFHAQIQKSTGQDFGVNKKGLMWNILENLGHFKYGAPYAICNFKVFGVRKRKRKNAKKKKTKAKTKRKWKGYYCVRLLHAINSQNKTETIVAEWTSSEHYDLFFTFFLFFFFFMNYAKPILRKIFAVRQIKSRNSRTIIHVI